MYILPATIDSTALPQLTLVTSARDNFKEWERDTNFADRFLYVQCGLGSHYRGVFSGRGAQGTRARVPPLAWPQHLLWFAVIANSPVYLLSGSLPHPGWCMNQNDHQEGDMGGRRSRKH